MELKPANALKLNILHGEDSLVGRTVRAKLLELKSWTGHIFTQL